MAENWLREYGYNATALPSRDLPPLSLLLRQRELDTRGGALSEILASSSPLPEVAAGETAASVGRSIEKSVEASLGLKILGALFGAGKDSKLGAETEYKRAKQISVTYENVTQDSVSVVKVDEWLYDAEVKAGRQAMIWLNDDKFAVVTKILRSATLSAVAKTESGGSIELSIPEIKGVVGGDIEISVDASNTSKITFKGKEPIVFGFEAFRLRYEGNQYMGMEFLDRKDIAPLRGELNDSFLEELGEPPDEGEAA